MTIGSIISITGLSYVPELDFYNRAREKIIDIVHNTGGNTNSKQYHHLSCYVSGLSSLEAKRSDVHAMGLKKSYSK